MDTVKLNASEIFALIEAGKLISSLVRSYDLKTYRNTDDLKSAIAKLSDYTVNIEMDGK